MERSAALDPSTANSPPAETFERLRVLAAERNPAASSHAWGAS